jgi:hypothetical protein
LKEIGANFYRHEIQPGYGVVIFEKKRVFEKKKKWFAMFLM